MMRLALLSVLSLSFLQPFSYGAILKESPFISSNNGYLNTTVTLQLGEYEVNGATVTAPLFDGTLPGTTFRIRAGDSLSVTFINDLPIQGAEYKHNDYSAPMESNLHFHGLFISGELPSDDSSLVVGPGESYEYTIEVPPHHFPGTHWLHPHRHGSTAFQVGGGAASAVIVEEPEGFLPPEVENAPEVLLVLQELVPRESEEVIAVSRGESLLFSDTQLRNRVELVNGQVSPTIQVNAGVWNRLRFINAGWVGDGYALTMEGCEMVLLAKDGVFIADFPRPISTAFIFTGGRADIMVRCPDPSTTYPIYSQKERGGSTLATIETASGDAVELQDLPSWTPEYPDYLQDLVNTPASEGCACITHLDNEEINGHLFDESVWLHEAFLGSVVERDVTARRHPYHQHTYPFQLVGGFRDTEYVKIGDWHDTFDGNAIVRYQPMEFATKMMIHCHKLTHEDRGMMAQEIIRNTTENEAACICGTDETRDGDGNGGGNRGGDEEEQIRWDRSSGNTWRGPAFISSLCIAASLLVLSSEGGP